MHIARSPIQRWAVPCWRSETPRIAAHATNHISSTCPQRCMYCYPAMQLLQHASKGYGGIAALIAASSTYSAGCDRSTDLAVSGVSRWQHLRAGDRNPYFRVRAVKLHVLRRLLHPRAKVVLANVESPCTSVRPSLVPQCSGSPAQRCCCWRRRLDTLPAESVTR
jgi:hypothetical protein